MNKKTLGVVLIVLIVAIAGVVYFGYQKGLLGGIGIGGIGKKSIMDAAREQGQTVMSKSKYLDECKKSDKEAQDMCYGIGAFYYRDASFCKWIKDAETKKNCNQENIEKWYSELEKGGSTSPFMPGGTIPGGEMFPGGENTGTVTPQGEGQEEGQKDPYSSAQEIVVPTGSAAGLASELKSIFGEVCGGAKLTTLNYNFPVQGSDMLVYVRKNKPTEEKLTSAFEKNGYEIEMPGEILIVKKGGLSLTVDWASPDREEEQEIVILTTKEE